MEEEKDSDAPDEQNEATRRRDSLPRIPLRQKSSDFADDFGQRGLRDGDLGTTEKRKGLGKLMRSKSALGIVSPQKTPKARNRNKSLDRSTSRFKQFLAFANASFSSQSDGELLADDDDDESLH